MGEPLTPEALAPLTASHVVVASPNKPRPGDPLTLAVADTLRRIEGNYAREGSGPGSRFEGELLEDVQARTAVAMAHAALAAERDRYRAALEDIRDGHAVYGDYARQAAREALGGGHG